MNFKEEKKKYVAPVMNVLDMGSKAVFLSCSSCDEELDNIDEYDDEFGFNIDNGKNRHV